MLSRVSLLTAATMAVLAIAMPQAHAAYILAIDQVGGDVVASGSGTLNTAGLSTLGSAGWFGEVNPLYGGAWVGTNAGVAVYSGATGPTTIGTGNVENATSDTGEVTGIYGYFGALYVPAGYVSGTALAGTATWSNTTISSLGLTPGTYTWTWGSGATVDSLTVDVQSVPEPATIAVLGIPAVMGLLRRRRAV